MIEARQPFPRHRVFLVDDHPIFRHGLRQIIAGDPSLAVCGEADSLRSALDAMLADPPDVALLELSLRGPGGLDLIRALRSHLPGLPILVLSMHDEDLYAGRAIRAGANGYLGKDQAPEDLVPAIKRAVAGELVLSPRMTAVLLRRALRGRGSGGGLPISPSDVLTERELEIYEHVGRGFGTRAIAEVLHISNKTVETHKANIKEKLDLAGATELLRSAVGWVVQASALPAPMARGA